MGLPLERWARQATLLDPIPRKVQEGDLLDLARYQRAYWSKIGHEIAESGDPTALESMYGGLLGVPPAAQLSNASINGELELWGSGGTAVYCPIPANSQMVPASYRLMASGQCTTAATPANAVWTPRLGLTTGGSAMGASGAYALTASITNSFWTLQGDVTCRSIGPGSAGSAIGCFLLHHRHAIGGAGDFITTTSSGTGQQIFGFTVATYNSTAAQGLFMGMANTVTTITWKVDQIHWSLWN